MAQTVTKDMQIGELLTILGTAGTRLFIPHAEGRGAQLEAIRLRREDFERLSGEAKALLNRRVYRTEAEWLSAPPAEPAERSLLLSLTPENIGRLENTDFAQIIAELEALDEAYYAPIPPVAALLDQYADPAGDAFFSARDLAARCQKRWLSEQGLQPYDVTDERQSGSRRIYR